MEKVYYPDHFKLNFKRSPGRIFLFLGLIFLISVVIAFIVFMLPHIYNAGNGDWVEGFKKFIELLKATFVRPIEEYYPTLRQLIKAIIIGMFFLLFFRLIRRSIIIKSDSIQEYYPIMTFLTWIPYIRKLKHKAKIYFSEVNRIWSDIFFAFDDYGRVRTLLVTGFESSNYSISFIAGFCGYFDFLSDIEALCPQASWDENTLLIIENNRRGIPIYKTER